MLLKSSAVAVAVFATLCCCSLRAACFVAVAVSQSIWALERLAEGIVALQRTEHIKVPSREPDGLAFALVLLVEAIQACASSFAERAVLRNAVWFVLAAFLGQASRFSGLDISPWLLLACACGFGAACRYAAMVLTCPSAPKAHTPAGMQRSSRSPYDSSFWPSVDAVAQDVVSESPLASLVEELHSNAMMALQLPAIELDVLPADERTKMCVTRAPASFLGAQFLLKGVRLGAAMFAERAAVRSAAWVVLAALLKRALCILGLSSSPMAVVAVACGFGAACRYASVLLAEPSAAVEHVSSQTFSPVLSPHDPSFWATQGEASEDSICESPLASMVEDFLSSAMMTPQLPLIEIEG